MKISKNNKLIHDALEDACYNMSLPKPELCWINDNCLRGKHMEGMCVVVIEYEGN